MPKGKPAKREGWKKSIKVQLEVGGVTFFMSRHIVDNLTTVGNDTNMLGRRYAHRAHEALSVISDDLARELLGDFGAWSDEELAGWPRPALMATLLQIAAGNARESRCTCNPSAHPVPMTETAYVGD